MQIFYTSSDPIKCAEYLDDARVTKMVTETAQILSTALDEHRTPLRSMVYRPTHRNHPCVRWACSTRANYEWLLRHFKALAMEFELRRGKTHKAWIKTYLYLALDRVHIPEGPLTTHANVAKRTDKGIDHTDKSPVDYAYQCYLNERWDTDRREPVWTGVMRKGEYYESQLYRYGLKKLDGPLRIIVRKE